MGLSFSGELPELLLLLLLLLRLPPVDGETGSEELLAASRESPAVGRALTDLWGDSMPLVKLGTERDCHSS